MTKEGGGIVPESWGRTNKQQQQKWVKPKKIKPNAHPICFMFMATENLLNFVQILGIVSH